jgi:pimeloyl-ACP methyl ester carboxylesterase
MTRSSAAAAKILTTLVLVLGTAVLGGAEDAAPAHESNYGANAAAGHVFVHDGVALYYEVYGRGQPLLLVHGNGGSIASLAAQIDYFRDRYQVIAMDSRDHGRSGDSPDRLTYEKMTDDLAALLDSLEVGPVDVLGWSDGGIEALLLGMRYPEKVNRLVAMAPNLNPSEDALFPETIALMHETVDSMSDEERDTPQGRRALKATEMMLEEPNIDVADLESIEAPTLIMVGEYDVIRPEHAVEISQHLRNGALKILRNAYHTAPQDDPVRFNRTVERFFRKPAGAAPASFDANNPRMRAQNAALYY